MRNLLSAGFLRLWQSKSLYTTLAIMAVIGAIEPILGYAAMRDYAAGGVADAAVSLDSRYFIFPFLSGILLSAFCALFTLLVMNCGRKSVSAAACLLGVFLLLLASIYLRSRLLAPEYLGGTWDANGAYVPGPLTPNPQYLDGPRRAVFEALYALLPSSQAVECASQQTQNLRWMPLYSLAAAALSTAAGLALFRQKDLK